MGEETKMSKELTDQQGTQHTALEMSAVSGNPPPKYSVNTHPASNFAYKMLEFSQSGMEILFFKCELYKNIFRYLKII